MKNKRFAIRMGVVGLTALCVTVGVVLATGAGPENDPLITLSYLNTTVKPAILEQVDDKVADYEQGLVDKLDGAIQDYSQDMEDALKAQQDQPKAASYKVVTLRKGQVLSLDIGCEVMLRIGSAVCVSPSSPGLIDVTGGATLDDGKDLVTNHLYMATITGRSIKATVSNTKVLVRGSYS